MESSAYLHRFFFFFFSEGMIFNFFAAESIVVKLLYPTLVLRIQEQHRLWREREKTGPILEKQRVLGLKTTHCGKYIKERHTDLLEHRFSYRLAKDCLSHAFPPGPWILLILYSHFPKSSGSCTDQWACSAAASSQDWDIFYVCL